MIGIEPFDRGLAFEPASFAGGTGPIKADVRSRSRRYSSRWPVALKKPMAGPSAWTSSRIQAKDHLPRDSVARVHIEQGHARRGNAGVLPLDLIHQLADV